MLSVPLLIAFLALGQDLHSGFTVRGQDAPGLCEPNPCKNDGYCELNADSTSFTCSCADYWSGLTCDVPPVCNISDISDFVQTPCAINYIKSSAPLQNSYLLKVPLTASEDLGDWTTNDTNAWITVSFPTTQRVMSVYVNFAGTVSTFNVALFKNGTKGPVNYRQVSPLSGLPYAEAYYLSGPLADMVKMDSFKAVSTTVLVWTMKIKTCATPKQPAEEASAVPVDEPSQGASCAAAGKPPQEASAVPADESPQEASAVPADEPPQEASAVPADEPPEGASDVPAEQPTK